MKNGTDGGDGNEGIVNSTFEVEKVLRVGFTSFIPFMCRMTTVEEWEEMTIRTMEEAERERCASCKLRQVIPELLKR